MSYIKVGSCNRCGKCCLTLSLGGPMLENPCILLGEDRCKFYVDTLNNEMYGHCLIYGRGNKPIKTVKDRYGKSITEAQIDWFNRNCIEYPSVSDREDGHILPSGCGFSFEVI